MSDPSQLTILGFGFLLGLRHALDADHLAAVSTVLAQRPSLRASSAVGLWWGVGHTLTLLIVGSVVLALGIHIPPQFELIAESGVGVLLIVLGGSLAVKLFRERWHMHSHHHNGDTHVHLHSHQRQDDHRHRHWLADSIRPLCIGMAHGLAGSAALMLIILATTQELGPGLLSIAVFGVGSIAGMMVIGLTISLPLVCSRSLSRPLFLGLQGFAGAASMGVGVWMLVKLVVASTGE
ncbi:MAG: urease accessory protein UreH [Nitrospira sp.]|nr:urease accessory protein UreH [Nitrospira sp.]MBH0182138.1 urease accessory protein UreH [Nitrospira sp.]